MLKTLSFILKLAIALSVCFQQQHLQTLAQLIPFGIAIPNVTMKPAPPSTKGTFIVSNIEFNDTYYLISLELYAVSWGKFQLRKNDWNLGCWSTGGGTPCAQVVSNAKQFSGSQYSVTSIAQFWVSIGYNYIYMTNNITVSKGETLQVDNGNMLGIDTANTPYMDTIVSWKPNGVMKNDPLVKGKGNAGVYLRAYVSLNPPTTTTTTTVTMTTIFNETTASTSSTTASTTTTPSVSIQFNSAVLVGLLTSNFTGDLTGCLVNCSGNGYCYYDSLYDEYDCQCNTNFTGTSCNVDERACSSSPCTNNGTCIDLYSNSSGYDAWTFYCECPQYYYGDYCGYKVNLCANVTCSLHGTCSDAVNNTAICSCYSGYLGTNCENQEQSLKVTKQVIQSTAIIAIAFIVFFYLIFVMCDLHSWYISRNRLRPKRKKKTDEKQSVQVGIYKVQYVS